MAAVDDGSPPALLSPHPPTRDPSREHSPRTVGHGACLIGRPAGPALLLPHPPPVKPLRALDDLLSDCAELSRRRCSSVSGPSSVSFSANAATLDDLPLSAATLYLGARRCTTTAIRRRSPPLSTMVVLPWPQRLLREAVRMHAATMQHLRHPAIATAFCSMGDMPQGLLLELRHTAGPLRPIAGPGRCVLPLAQLRGAAASVGSALQFLHGRGFVHGGVRLGSLHFAGSAVFSPDPAVHPTVVLGDCGVQRLIHRNDVRRGTFAARTVELEVSAGLVQPRSLDTHQPQALLRPLPTCPLPALIAPDPPPCVPCDADASLAGSSVGAGLLEGGQHLLRQYAAPEVLSEGATRQDAGMAADLWGLGVCLYVLTFGHFPFGGDTGREVDIAVHRDTPLHLGRAARRLSVGAAGETSWERWCMTLAGLLQKSPLCRMTADELVRRYREHSPLVRP